MMRFTKLVIVFVGCLLVDVCSVDGEDWIALDKHTKVQYLQQQQAYAWGNDSADDSTKIVISQFLSPACNVWQMCLTN